MKTLSNQTHVSLVAGMCLLALVVMLKNVVQVPAEILSRDVVLYIIVYWSLGFFPSQQVLADHSRLDRPLVWDALLVVITAAIIGVYVLSR